MQTATPMAPERPASFTCPRCGREVTERFYGPCSDCRDQLRSTMSRQSGQVVPEAVRFEPKANVVPNFVATKEAAD